MKCLLGQNARIGGVKPETLWAMERAKEVMWDKGHAIVFTSIMDRKHQRNSLHYVGYAFDFDVSLVNVSMVREIEDELTSRLGNDFDVVVNVLHKIIHVEFQPEGGLNL